MVKKRRKKTTSNRTFFWVVVLLVLSALIIGYRLWYCLFNVVPQFNYILISKDNNPLKVLNGETVRLNPRNRLKILDISTNICFNQGVRLVAEGLDINALVYGEATLADLFLDRDTYDRYSFRVELKRYNQDIGYVNFIVEPFVEDWLEKADRSIGHERKAAVLERALKLVPDDKQIRDRLIQEYLALKRWEDASRMLEDKAKESPDQAILYNLLEVYEKMGRIESVISTLRRLVELNPEDGNVRLQLADTLEKKGRLKDAIKEYEGLLKITAEEDHLPVYKTLGFLYTKTGQTEKAISAYLKAVEMDKNDVNLYYNLSFLYEEIDQIDKANLYLGKAIQLKPEDVEGRLKLSESLIKNERLQEAEKYLEEVIKNSPKSMEAWILMMRIAEKEGNKKALKRAYENILSLDPTDNTVIYNLGIIEYEAGNLTKALSYFKKYITSYPKDIEARSFLFDIYRKQKEDDLAFEEAKAIIKLRPQESSYYHYIFEYLNNIGNYKDMVSVMEDGLKTYPKDGDLRRYLILAYLQTGKDDLASEQMKEILKSNPEDITILLQLARLQEKQKRYKEALETYKRIIDISPGHEEAEDAYLRLRLEDLPHE